MKILMYCLLALNVGVWLMYGIDKWKAKSGRWRIPEKVLLLAAFAGGSVGAYCGCRHCFTHKKALSTYRCPLAKICKHVLCFLYICMDELLRKNMSDALDFDVTSSNILALS